MTVDRYDPVAQTLHWLTTLAIVAAFVLPQFFDAFPRGEPRNAAIALHRSIGMIVLVCVAARLVWRLYRRPPEPITEARWMVMASKVVHWALYALMVLIPVLGLAATWAHGRDVVIFNLITLPTMMAETRPLLDQLETAHAITAKAIIVLASLHALAAIGHQVILKDGTLARMVPFLR